MSDDTKWLGWPTEFGKLDSVEQAKKRIESVYDEFGYFAPASDPDWPASAEGTYVRGDYIKQKDGTYTPRESPKPYVDTQPAPIQITRLGVPQSNLPYCQNADELYADTENLPPAGYIRGRPSIMPLPKIDVKDTNPKDAVGVRKWRQFTTVPFTVLWELGVAMLEGARKYGRHNYRIAGVRSSVYVDAALGHIHCYWEGEDIDPLSGLHHVTKAIASLTVLRDAMIQDMCVDDRPPKTKNLAKVKADLQAAVDKIFETIPEALPVYLEGDQVSFKPPG